MDTWPPAGVVHRSLSGATAPWTNRQAGELLRRGREGRAPHLDYGASGLRYCGNMALRLWVRPAVRTTWTFVLVQKHDAEGNLLAARGTAQDSRPAREHARAGRGAFQPGTSVPEQKRAAARARSRVEVNVACGHEAAAGERLRLTLSAHKSGSGRGHVGVWRGAGPRRPRASPTILRTSRRCFRCGDALESALGEAVTTSRATELWSARGPWVVRTTALVVPSLPNETRGRRLCLIDTPDETRGRRLCLISYLMVCRCVGASLRRTMHMRGIARRKARTMTVTYAQVAPVVYGVGAIASLAEEAKKLGATKVLCVYTSDLAGSAAVKGAHASLEAAGMPYVDFDQVVPDPPVDAIDAGAALATAEGADCLVAVGGGSSMDAAKAIAVVLTRGGSVVNYPRDPPLQVTSRCRRSRSPPPPVRAARSPPCRDLQPRHEHEAGHRRARHARAHRPRAHGPMLRASP